MLKKATIALSTTLVLAGCVKEEVKTVEWFKSHENERIELLKECDNNAEKQQRPIAKMHSKREQKSTPTTCYLAMEFHLRKSAIRIQPRDYNLKLIRKNS